MTRIGDRDLVDFGAIGEKLFSDISKLQPLGRKIEPVFGKRCIFKSAPITFGKTPQKVALTQAGLRDREVEGIAWNTKALPEPNQTVDLAVQLNPPWNNEKV